MSAAPKLVSRFVSSGYDSLSAGDHSGSTTVVAAAQTQSRTKLTLLTLTALLYANCIGSGYGFEDSIGAAGPLYTLIFCLVVPWIWSLPTGLAVSELATSIKSNSGVLMWVNVAFPPRVSCMNVIATVFIIFASTASFPNLAAEYLTKIIPSTTSFDEAAVKIMVVMLSAFMNITGVEIVGRASLVLSIITALPFIIFSLEQLVFRGGFSLARMAMTPAGGLWSIDWPVFLSIASWNYSNFENVGCVVEDVHNPKKTLAAAFIPLCLSTYVSYLLPTAAGVSAMVVSGASSGHEFDQWQSGFWPSVAEQISGSWLKHYIFFGAMLSSFGYTVTAICCSSRMLASMGGMGIFNKGIANFISRKHAYFGTPVNSILVIASVTTVFSILLSFSEMVAICQAIYCFRLIFVFWSVVRLRQCHPSLHRPYAIPIQKTRNLTAALSLPVVVSLVIAVASSLHSTFVTISCVGFVASSAIVSHLYISYAKPYGFLGSVQYFYAEPGGPPSTGLADKECIDDGDLTASTDISNGAKSTRMELAPIASSSPTFFSRSVAHRFIGVPTHVDGSVIELHNSREEEEDDDLDRYEEDTTDNDGTTPPEEGAGKGSTPRKLAAVEEGRLSVGRRF